MKTIPNSEPSILVEDISLTDNIKSICSNCEKKTFCTWRENNKNYCEEYE